MGLYNFPNNTRIVEVCQENQRQRHLENKLRIIGNWHVHLIDLHVWWQEIEGEDNANCP